MVKVKVKVMVMVMVKVRVRVMVMVRVMVRVMVKVKVKVRVMVMVKVMLMKLLILMTLFSCTTNNLVDPLTYEREIGLVCVSVMLTSASYPTQDACENALYELCPKESLYSDCVERLK